jgi:hypothetical protein
MHVLEVQCVSTSGSTDKLIRERSSGQHFLFKESSGQQFMLKGLSDYNFMFKRPNDQGFVFRRSSVQHVIFKRSVGLHWKGISAVRPVIRVVCLRAAIEMLRYHAQIWSMDLASSFLKLNSQFNTRNLEKLSTSRITYLLCFLSFFLCSF